MTFHSLRGAVFAVLLATAACTSGTTEDASSTTSDTAASATAEVVEEATPSTTAAPETAESEESTTEAPPETTPSTRIVEMPAGTFEVPYAPERVVIIDVGTSLPTAIDLGVDVFGTWDALGLGAAERTTVTQDEWDELEIIGSGLVPNVEGLAASAPDLILHRPNSPEEIELLSQIAPTVELTSTLSWQDDALDLASVFGLEAEMETRLDDYRSRADALAQRIDDEVGDPAIALLRVRPDTVRVHTNLHFSGELLSEFGLRTLPEFVVEPAATRNESTLLVNIGTEGLGQVADADYIFLLPLGTLAQSPEAVQQSLDDLEASGLWRTLAAVQNDNVLVVGHHWFLGSQRAAEQALTDIEELFFGG